MHYTSAERRGLLALAIAGLVGLNGVFVWAMVARPETLMAALHNPIAAAFIAEAILLVPVLAYLLARWHVSRVHWMWFVLLALVGGIAFALPVVVLWRSDAID